MAKDDEKLTFHFSKIAVFSAKKPGIGRCTNENAVRRQQETGYPNVSNQVSKDCFFDLVEFTIDL
jgi:hypothetical protein